MMQAKPWNGKPIKMPGVYTGVPIERYHAADAAIEPSISSSGLRKIFTASPKHYWAHSPYNPDAVESEETAALTLGRAAHHLLFAQEGFRKQFAVRPEKLGRNMPGSACRIWIEDRQKEGKTVITEKQLEHVAGICASLKTDPAVKAGCLNGRIEESYFWKDQTTGFWLKSRPDANPTGDLSFVVL